MRQSEWCTITNSNAWYAVRHVVAIHKPARALRTTDEGVVEVKSVKPSGIERFCFAKRNAMNESEAASAGATPATPRDAMHKPEAASAGAAPAMPRDDGAIPRANPRTRTRLCCFAIANARARRALAPKTYEFFFRARRSNPVWLVSPLRLEFS